MARIETNHREKEQNDTFANASESIISGPLSNRSDDSYKSTNKKELRKKQKLEYIQLLSQYLIKMENYGIEEINGLPYLSPIVDNNGCVYSIDMVRLKFKFNKAEDVEFFFSIIRDASDYMAISPYCYEYIERRKWYQYHHNFNFELVNFNECGELLTYKRSFYLGISVNGDTNKLLQGVLEFNPNKVDGAVIRWLLKIISTLCKIVQLQRFDLAIDVPCQKQNIRLLKDSRVYKLVAPSVDCNTHTEYLGIHQKSGFVKVYNKQNESNLNTPLTRVEITSEFFEYEYFIKQFPEVYWVGSSTLLPFAELKDTDKVLYLCLRDNVDKDTLFKQLGRKKQEKLKKYLYEDINDIKLGIDEKTFYQITGFYRKYLKLKGI